MIGFLKRSIKNADNLEDRKLILFAFLISLTGRIAVILTLGQEQLLYETGGIALNLVSGNGFSFDFFPPATQLQETCVISPFYPYLLAGSYFVFGVNTIAIAAVQIIQSLVGAATVYPLYYLARDYYSKRTAIFSVLIFALYPDFLHWSYLIQQLTFVTFFVVSIMYAYHLYSKDPAIRRSLALGLVAGFGLLVDAVIVSIVGLLFIWMLFALIKQKLENRTPSSRDVRRKVVCFVLAVAVCGLIIAPWELRCLSVYDGNFVFIKASGFNLWLGNNANYTATGIPYWITTESLLDLNLAQEGDIDSALGQLAVTYMLAHIPQTLMNSIRKFIEFWWFPKVYPEMSPLPRQLLYAPLLLFAVIALFMDRKRLGEIAPLLLPLLAFTIIYSVVFVLPHHRIPIQPILFILSAAGLEYTATRLNRKGEAVTVQ